MLSGEIGTGKTTLCRTVLSQLDRKTFSTFVPDPFVTREDLLKTLLIGFGVASVADVNGGRLQGASRQDLSYPLYEFLDSLVPLQAFAVLVIDEAQNLSLGVMEEIRILAELEKREKLLQVVLVGQPELRDNLRLPQMRQVEQRVTVRCELTPLAFRDVTEYVQHRLRVARRDTPDGVEFTGGALEAVHLASGGVPRLINLVCDRALQRAFDGPPQDDRSRPRERRGARPRSRRSHGGCRPGRRRRAAAAVRAGARRRAAVAATAPRRHGGDASARAERAPAGGVTAFEPEAPPAPRPEAAQSALGVRQRARRRRRTPAGHRDAAALVDMHRRQRAASCGRWRARWASPRRRSASPSAPACSTRARPTTSWRRTRRPRCPRRRNRDASWSRTAAPVPDALTVAFTDARAHEPDVFTAQAATFRDRQAADALVAELDRPGLPRALGRSARRRHGAVQQVFVDGYGTLENALSLVGRLRTRASTAAHSSSASRAPSGARILTAR